MTTRAAVDDHPLWHKSATVRLVLSVIAGVAAFLLLTPHAIDWRLRALAGWDAASFTLAALAWIIILRADAAETRRRAGVDDPGQKTVFFMAVASSLVSLIAAGLGLRWVKSMPAQDEAIWTAIAFGAVVLSWILTHTSFTLRYAHLYYRQQRGRAPGQECVEFPGTDRPADIDFAYLAFTIGMCFQTSDVVVKTSAMRREVLLHAMLSFVYNTAIVALALNVVISLLS
jgi:uncharacterized membrane protein